jgi:hypothetical protein
MTFEEFEAKYPSLIPDITSLSDDDKRAFLKAHSAEIRERLDVDVCPHCGAIDGHWCCYKNPEFQRQLKENP